MKVSDLICGDVVKVPSGSVDEPEFRGMFIGATKEPGTDNKLRCVWHMGPRGWYVDVLPADAQVTRLKQLTKVQLETALRAEAISVWL